MLLWCIAALTAAGLFVIVMRFGFDHGRLLGFSARFDLNTEGNVPTYFSALQLAFAALILMTIARAKHASGDPYARHWSVLCGIFAFLSVDEATQLHERLREPMLALFDLTGVWGYAWFIPYGTLVAAFLFAYRRFFMHLPPHIRMLFASACAVYVGAAIGVELAQLHFVVSTGYGDRGPLYAALCYSLEECAEMLGVALLVYGVLRYAAENVAGVFIEFSAQKAGSSAVAVPESRIRTIMSR